jgi:hypothetical protein
MIPSMGGTAIGEQLQRFAIEAPDKTAIVELGTWLGAGTEQLALGVQTWKKDIEIHTYDNFIIRGNEVDKAAKFGVTLYDGLDSLPLVKSWLKKMTAKIIFHKGEITKDKWNGRPISIYVDDACKYEKTFIPALRNFSPFFIPGKTILVLMDYWFYIRRPDDAGLRFQPKFMTEHKENFDHFGDAKDHCVAYFRYLGGLKI